MMPTIVEQFRQQNSHWNLPTTRRPNNISSAAHPDYSNTFNLFHALFLVICSVVIMLASPTVHAIDASGIVTVPCGTETTYGPVVALNTTFLLRDCYNSPNNTGLIVYLNSASEALAGLSIVVENSNRVYVIVAGVARFPPGNMLSLNISKVNIVCRNVTNDIAADFSMFRISSFSAVRNAYLYVSDVRHFRSTTILNLNYVDSFSGLTVTIANTSSFATNALVSFALIADAVRDSSVTMTNVTSISSFVSFQAGVFDPLLPVYEVFAERTNISLISCAMVGSSNTSPFAVYISDTHMDQQSHIAIVGLQVQMATAQSAGALLAKNSNIGDVYVSIFNFSSISPNIVVQVVVTQNTTLDGAVIAVNSALISGVTASSALCFSILSSVIANAHLSATNVSLGTFQSTTTLYLLSVQYFTTVPATSRLSNTIITLDNCKSTAQVIAIQNTTLNGVVIAVNSVLISGVTAPQAFCFNILSSTVANSYLSANNVSLSASQSTTVLYLLVVQYSATVPAPSSLSNTSITLSNCSTAALSAIAHVLNVAVTTTQLSVINVVMSATSPYLPILLSSLPGTTNQLNLTVLDSYLIGAYLIRLDMLTAVNSNVALSASTLVVTQSAYFPSNALFALTIVSAVLTNSTSTVSTTDVVGVPSGLNAGWIVGIASCTFSGVSVSLSFASLTKSGGILYVGDSVLDSTTTVTAAVASSITIPSGFPNQVFYVLSTAIRKNSTLKLLLPPLVRMDAASSTTAGISALYIAGSTLSELSSIQVSGVGPRTHLYWPNGTLWLDSCNVPKDCSIHLSNLVVTGTDANVLILGSTPSAVLMVENCSFAQLHAAMQSRQFIAIVAPTVSASLNVAVFLMRCTFTTAAWDPQIRNALVALSGVTSKGNASCTLVFESDQLTLLGVNLLIGVTTPNNSQTAVLVTSVVLRCGWWGRYSFTSSLSPIHLAMKGKLLRGEDSGITPSTVVNAFSDTLLTSIPSQCAMQWHEQESSWSSTETKLHTSPALQTQANLTGRSVSATTGLALHFETQPPFLTSLSPSAAARPVVSAVVGSQGAASSAAVLIRSALSIQLAQCASDDPGTNSSLSAALIGSSSSNIFQINVGSDDNAVGYGYRGVLVSSLLLVLGSAVLLIISALVKRRLDSRSRRPTHPVSWRTIAADFGLPGWLIAGPCATAVPPMLSAAVSLASVSPWTAGTGAGDGVLIMLSLLLGSTLVAWCFKALLRPRHGGWFTAVPRGPAHELQRVPRAVRWLLGGAYSWAPDPRLRTAANRRFMSAYGSLFLSMWPHRHWWFLMDMSTSVVVGFLAALPSLFVHRDDAATLIPAICTGALHTATAVQVAILAAFTLLHPVAVRWEYGGSLLSTLLGAVGALLTSFAAEGFDGLDNAANGVAIVQMIISIIMLLLGFSEDILALLTSQPTRWRRLLPDDSKLSGSPLRCSKRCLLLSQLHVPRQKEATSTCFDCVANSSDTYEALEALILKITEARLSSTSDTSSDNYAASART